MQKKIFIVDFLCQYYVMSDSQVTVLWVLLLLFRKY